jgi:SPP1 gp7 family putative phage head morphogenesis protein
MTTRPPEDIYTLGNRLAADLRRGDAATAAQLVAAYQPIYQRIQDQVATLVAQRAAAMAAGEPVTPGWLFQAGRWAALEAQVRQALLEYAALAGQQITLAQTEALLAGNSAAMALLVASLPPGFGSTFAGLPSGAITQLVGYLGDGSPLTGRLQELAPGQLPAIRNALVVGLGTGQNPRTIARTLRPLLGVPLWQALRLARTETLRAYRAAALDRYAQSDVVQGWIWWSALGRRSCAVCWAMHGTFHPLTEPFGSHPNCRCTVLPATKPWAELGLAGLPDRPAPVPGGDRFAALAEGDQQAILGPGKWAAYQAGEITLADLVAVQRSATWGVSRMERSLEEARARHGG